MPSPADASETGSFPTRSVPVTDPVAGSIVVTVPSSAFATHSDPKADAIAVGPRPTGIVCVSPSPETTRLTVPSEAFATHTAPAGGGQGDGPLPDRVGVHDASVGRVDLGHRRVDAVRDPDAIAVGDDPGRPVADDDRLDDAGAPAGRPPRPCVRRCWRPTRGRRRSRRRSGRRRPGSAPPPGRSKDRPGSAIRSRCRPPRATRHPKRVPAGTHRRPRCLRGPPTG